MSREAERAVLGCLLTDGAVLWDIVGIVKPKDFSLDAHRKIFAAMCVLAKAGGSIDLLTVKDELRRSAQLEEVGGSAFVSSLVDTIPAVSHVARYAEIVAEKSRLRALAGLGQTIAQRATSGESAQQIAAECSVALAEVATGRGQGPVPLRDIAKRTAARLEERMARGVWITGIATGLHKLDSYTLGLQRGVLSLLAARPRVGKTAVAIAIAREALRRGERVMFVQMDMSEAMFGDRLLAAWAGVSSIKIRSGKGLDSDEIAAIAKADSEQRKLGDQLSLEYRVRELAQIAAFTRRVAKGGTLDLLVIDHVGHVRGGQGRERYQQIGDVTSRLIELAGQTNAAALVLSQLNREAEHRPPTLSDLRESGNLEQDARVAILLDRPHFRQDDIPECQIDVLVPKNEGEIVSNLTAHFDLRIQRVTEEREQGSMCRHCSANDQPVPKLFEQEEMN